MGPGSVFIPMVQLEETLLTGMQHVTVNDRVWDRKVSLDRAK